MADLGPESPLPVVSEELDQPYKIGDGVPEELRAAADYGRVPNIFPYRMQDGYSRERTPHELTAVVLENSSLRAVVLPGLGGRVWELEDKRTHKQLLHTHGTVQFANIALRKAWFAGGLEWNIGTRGHSPTTCSPLHSAIVRTPDGRQILRMWEFERLREVVFQVDVWLPAGSDVLFAAVRIRNPNPDDVPMYWWSNAAVPEREGTRVIAPALEAYGSDYSNDIARIRPTELDGVDATWLVNNSHAADYFFDIAPGQRHWIVAADHDGDGLAMLSTDRLRGKKLFVWGQGQGGQRWQEWLSPGAGPYAEIQAGLAQTQFEHVPMPAGADWSWVEAYGNAQLDPNASHSPDWDKAVAHASARLHELLPEEALEEALAAHMQDTELPPNEPVLEGSGWGSLEAVRRHHSRSDWIDETGTPFPDALENPEVLENPGEEVPWLRLLGGEGFDGADSFVAGSDWEELLAADGGPEALFHLATMQHARQDFDAAIVGYREVLDPEGLAGSSVRTQALAHRGLALALLAVAEKPAEKLAQNPNQKPNTRGETAAATNALQELEAACRLEPESLPLLAEAMTVCIRWNDPHSALELASKAPEGITQAGRIRFLSALALADTGQAEAAAEILREGVEIPDLREGEDSIAELWQRVCPDEPVPARYRFSMW
ncbi:DUF5107 domain-containing protein [Arthrobacter sp. ISL-30]|nr:DUF5107 domain-containing protein [Arthrobacter sp. ISL-30]